MFSEYLLTESSLQLSTNVANNVMKIEYRAELTTRKIIFVVT